MGIETFSIIMNNPQYHIFHPGDIVAGTVKLITSSDTDLSEGMTITLFGLAKVEWTEGSGQHRHTYSSSEEIFENSLVLSCSHDQSEYPFSMQIPVIACLPWSHATMHGMVEYGVKAIIKRPWYKLGNKKAVINITINSHLSSRISSSSKNLQYYTERVTSNKNESRVGFCCIPFCCWYLLSPEKLNLTLTTPTLWSYPGEQLPFTLEVDNMKTKRQLGNAKVQLVGTWLHIASAAALFAGSKKEKPVETVVHEEFVQMSLSPYDQAVKKGIFKIPMDVMPTQVECGVLQLTYKLRGVVDEISGYTCIKTPATVEIDLLIGTLGANDLSTSAY